MCIYKMTSAVRLLLLVLAASWLAAALNVTILAPPRPRPKRAAAAAATASTLSAWVVSLGCVLKWSDVEQLRDRIPKALPACQLVLSGQGHASSLLRLMCVPAAGQEADILRTFRALTTSRCWGHNTPFFGVTADDTVNLATVAVEQASAPWHLDRADQQLLPRDGIFRTNRTGAGVVAYHIDSGVHASHEEVEGRASVVVDFVVRPHLWRRQEHYAAQSARARL